ncbi:Putative mycofactocin biosynthesis transcriptional regulator MftR [Gordonia insulae]|uniref:Mycofactocin biosynthesis transcriptional regulator MftR n=1 Tax=Gordonia insulae TaxID=2420509 RepID=A0A3G8JKJ1_9ACTN|nr:Putative mycofactocin biosynthesis transcriptional regulator MftR [Gordonia insulae]
MPTTTVRLTAVSETTPITRRASYGPSSPEVGSRGANTRTKIVDVSLDLFGRVGFFNTSVDAIAKEADISRATLYQYFPGKDEIFLELLDVCGRALFRVARRIGPLGPTKVGFDNLNWWLGEWSWVFDRYSTMFVQWTSVAMADTSVRPQIDSFMSGYTRMVTARLEQSELHGIEPRVAAMAMIAIVHRMNLFLATDRTYGRDTQAVVDSLSVYLQLLLFPDTPSSVLNSIPLETPPENPVINVPPLPSIAGLSMDDRTANLSKRAVNTVRTLVDAGAKQFQLKGYHRTSVDDIVEEAGLARGTFYKYFSEKQDLLVTVSIEGIRHALEHAERLSKIDLTDPDTTELRAWISSFTGFMTRFSGSIGAWTEKTTDNDIVTQLGICGQAAMDSAMVADLVTRKRDYHFDPVIAAIIFRSLVTRVPQAAQELSPPLSEDEIADLVIDCVGRGFFSHLT